MREGSGNHCYSTQYVIDQGSSESGQWLGVLLGLGEDDRALQRTHDEGCEVCAVSVRSQLALMHRLCQTIGDVLLNLVEDLADALANDVAVNTDFDAEVADQTTLGHSVRGKAGNVGVNIRQQPLDRRARLITQRLLDDALSFLKRQVKDLQPERLFRNEMIGERPIGHLGGNGDIANAGIGEATFMNDPQAFGQDLVTVGYLAHGGNMVIQIATVKAALVLPDECSWRR
jgi:hypothetical protein